LSTPSQLPFSYEVEMSGDTTRIKCHGRLVGDATVELKQLVKPMIPKVRRIIIDLSDVPFMDSSGLGALVSLKVSAGAAAYCSLEYVNFAPLVKELLRTTRLAELLGA